MNVKRKEKCVPLSDLEPGQRFRIKDLPHELWQVGLSQNSEVPLGRIACNKDHNGALYTLAASTLVEHVKGHWQPDEEEEGLVKIRNVEAFAVVEYEGRFWQLRSARCRLYALENAGQKTLDGSALVRVVHGAFVEDGAKIEGVGHE